MSTGGELVVGLTDKVLSILGQPGAAARVLELQKQGQAADLLERRKQNENERHELDAQLARETPMLEAAVDRELAKVCKAEQELEAARNSFREASGNLTGRRIDVSSRIRALEAQQRATCSRDIIDAALAEFTRLEEVTRRRGLDRIEQPVKGSDGQSLWDFVRNAPVTKKFNNMAAINSLLGYLRECCRILREDLPLRAMTDVELHERIAGLRSGIGDGSELAEV